MWLLSSLIDDLLGKSEDDWGFQMIKLIVMLGLLLLAMYLSDKGYI